jgi:hypothetical protein
LDEKRAVLAEGRGLFPNKGPSDFMRSKRTFEDIYNLKSDQNELVRKCQEIINSST